MPLGCHWGEGGGRGGFHSFFFSFLFKKKRMCCIFVLHVLCFGSSLNRRFTKQTYKKTMLGFSYSCGKKGLHCISQPWHQALQGKKTKLIVEGKHLYCQETQTSQVLYCCIPHSAWSSIVKWICVCISGLFIMPSILGKGLPVSLGHGWQNSHW